VEEHECQGRDQDSGVHVNASVRRYANRIFDRRVSENAGVVQRSQGCRTRAELFTLVVAKTDISFKDHFSGHAGSYAAARPVYPESLFACLATLCTGHDIAWDCATGSGQAARSLAPFFDKVLATDASQEQIASAEAHPKIEFRVATAEDSGLDADSVDLITVAQALHWFDFDAFFAEACRVLKPGGVLAAWSYERTSLPPECKHIIEKAYTETKSYWPPERQLVENHYRDITMPMPEIPVESFEMRLDWTVEQMLAYMRTWSGTQRYQRAKGSDPIALFEQELRQAWGAGKRDVRWPLTLKVGRKRHRD
jgi:SAM-dependent methyltransferase